MQRRGKEKIPVLAICYDFDKTLSPDDMQAQGYIQEVGYDVPDFWRKSNDLAARFARRPTCGACRGALVACGDRPAPTEAAAETKSFCPCHKTGENPVFSPVFFFHVLHGFGVHLGSDTGFSHQVLSVSNRSHPLQHPKRTRFRLFRAFPGAFSHFLLFCGCKIPGLIFVHLAA